MKPQEHQNVVKRRGGLAEVFQSTNKKEDFLCEELRWESPFDKEYDFTAKNCYIRIQGTSSTKYPWKNIRIYLNKGENPQLWVGGELKTGTSGDSKADAKKNVYAMSPTARAVSVITCKCDYSDSSMTHNTGGAKLWDYVCKQLGIVAPTQHLDPQARISIEGYPCDIYNQEDDGKVTYYGQYNFNNDKSKSDAVWGMGNINTERGACSLEFLNNTQPLCLFKTMDETDTSFASFDDALEFNIPEDVTWATATDGQRTAIKRLWNFIGRSARSCGARIDDAEAQYNDFSHFNSADFKRHISEYFDVDNILLWWIFTDYLALVDQRAKNMILRTIDGLQWFFTYYDGDTALLLRNDAFLAYLYNLNRNTYDLEANKYAFEGHSSWLWALVQGSFGAELREMAGRLRKVMTNEVILRFLNEEQMNAWSERAYNKSGALKYIVPATIGTQFKDVSGQVQTVKSNYIHALQGNRLAHRLHTVAHRGKFLDAMYITDAFRSDNIDAYINRTDADAPSIVKVIASEPYRYGYGTNNKPLLAVSASVAKGEGVEVAIAGAFTLNDPIRIYGASGIRVLDLTRINQAGASNFPLQNTLVLDKCTALREIRAEQAKQVQTANFVLGIGSVPTLEHLNVRNIRGISVGTAGAFDLTTQRRLKSLDARGTGAVGIAFAEGALIAEAYMPETLTALTLRNLPKLTQEGLHFENWSNITALNFSACPYLSWQELVGKCTSLRYIRIEGVDLKGNGSDLDRWKTLGGLMANGSATTGARLVGKYQLTKWRDDINDLRKAFPELDIRQVPYSGIVRYENISDPSNMANYYEGEEPRLGEYAIEGHFKAYKYKRHRAMVCKTDSGEVVACRLSDDAGSYYSDGTRADTSEGTEGYVMIFEPEKWYKGVKDVLSNKFYDFLTTEQPAEPNGTRIMPSQMKKMERMAVATSGVTITECLVSNASYNVYEVDVSAMNGTLRTMLANSVLYGGIFIDAQGNVLETLNVQSEAYVEAADYVFCQIPNNATAFLFTLSQAIVPNYVWVTNSNSTADIEPDWIHFEGRFVGIYPTSFNNAGEPLSCMQGVKMRLPASEMAMKLRTVGHNWSQIDLETANHILLMAQYNKGTRDVSSMLFTGHVESFSPVGSWGDIRSYEIRNEDAMTFGLHDDISMDFSKNRYIATTPTGIRTEHFYATTLGYYQVFNTLVPLGLERANIEKLIGSPAYNRQSYMSAIAHGRELLVLPRLSKGSERLNYATYNNFESSYNFVYLAGQKPFAIVGKATVNTIGVLQYKGTFQWVDPLTYKTIVQ